MKSLRPSLHGLLLLLAGSFLVALAPRLALAEGAGARPGDPEHRARPAVAQAVERAPGRELVAGAMPLPEPIEPQALARSLADQPQNYLLLDVRPASAFAEYHVPGAQSVTPEQALEQAPAADAAVRLVILDRDGTIAWAVAGVIAHARGARVVRVLDGGTARYWRDVEILRGVQAALPMGTHPAPAGRAAPAAAPAKKRSAGC